MIHVRGAALQTGLLVETENRAEETLKTKSPAREGDPPKRMRAPQKSAVILLRRQSPALAVPVQELTRSTLTILIPLSNPVAVSQGLPPVGKQIDLFVHFTL